MTEESTPMITFTSLGAPWVVKGRGKVYGVLNPRDTDNSDWSWLVGHRVILDGRPVQVTGVERFALGGIYRAGKPIGLLTKEIEEETITHAAQT